LGDSLALSRWSMSARGLAGSTFDVGPYEIEQINVTEVDAEGRTRRGEIFANDRLGHAIVRLYERYAELLPEGPARTRAAATALSVATLWQYNVDHLDGYARVFAAGIESVDHRILGTWSAQGAEAVLQNLRSWFDLSRDVTVRSNDVLALRADAFLVRVTIFGTDRDNGGAFERPYLALWAFGTDGLVTRWEQF